MNNFETILTFNHPTELDIVRMRLEAEGIECIVPEEFTVVFNPLYTNHAGAVRLQVRARDMERANEILIQFGYIKNESEHKPMRESAWLKIGSTWPVLKSFKAEVRVTIIISIILFAAPGLAYWMLRPSTKELLTEKSWCLQELNYLDHHYASEDKGPFFLAIHGNCKERIDFFKNGTMEMSNPFSTHFKGKWELDDGILIISNVNNFDTIFNGKYEIELEKDYLSLISEKTEMGCEVRDPEKE